jgi:hypothetical protein
MRMNDRNKTRIRLDAVTSYYPNRKVNSDQKSGYVLPSIILTIGSCLLELIYDKEEDRDSDIDELDRLGYMK